MGQGMPITVGIDFQRTIKDGVVPALNAKFADMEIKKEMRKQRRTLAEFKEEVIKTVGTSDEYTFSKEQLDALIPVYHWAYTSDSSLQIMSTSPTVHAQYNWHRTRKTPSGYVYSKAVPDSEPVKRLHFGAGSRYWHGTDAQCKPHMDKKPIKVDDPCWHQPTKGPFTTITTGCNGGGFVGVGDRVNVFVEDPAYTMTKEQIDALIPIYHWYYKGECALLSVHETMHAQFGWTRTSKDPFGFVYSKAVKDSEPVHRLHYVPGHGAYWFGTAAECSPWKDVDCITKDGVVWYQPTKGPFTVATSGGSLSCQTDQVNVFV